MILVDSNVLLYAVQVSSPRHSGAKAHLEELFSSKRTIALTWLALLAFLRISTKREVFSSPLSPDQALSIIGNWLHQPNCIVLAAGPKHFQILSSLIASSGVAGNLSSDAHLAAISIEHSAELHSFDSDFSRFAQLRFYHLR